MNVFTSIRQRNLTIKKYELLAELNKLLAELDVYGNWAVSVDLAYVWNSPNEINIKFTFERSRPASQFSIVVRCDYGTSVHDIITERLGNSLDFASYLDRYSAPEKETIKDLYNSVFAKLQVHWNVAVEDGYTSELLSCLIDTAEDWMAGKGITIEGEAPLIVGEDYDHLADAFAKVLRVAR